MRKSNDLLTLFFVILFLNACSNTSNHHATGNTETKDSNYRIIQAPPKSPCSEIEGEWKMFNFISGERGKKGPGPDTTVILRIKDCHIWRLKHNKPVDSATLVKKLEPSRTLYEWSGVEDRYIRYAPQKDILILNIKGFDSGTEHYRRVK